MKRLWYGVILLFSFSGVFAKDPISFKEQPLGRLIIDASSDIKKLFVMPKEKHLSVNLAIQSVKSFQHSLEQLQKGAFNSMPRMRSLVYIFYHDGNRMLVDYTSLEQLKPYQLRMIRKHFLAFVEDINAFITKTELDDTQRTLLTSLGKSVLLIGKYLLNENYICAGSRFDRFVDTIWYKPFSWVRQKVTGESN